MKIPNQLPQFEDERALIVVAGTHHGKLYAVKNGTLQELEDIEDGVPEYSDNEGYFASSGFGVFLGSGIPPKHHVEEEIERRFWKHVAEELAIYVKALTPTTIYLFDPDYAHGALTEELQAHVSGITVMPVKHGNYVNEEPLKLVQMIADWLDQSPAPERPESVEPWESDAAEKRTILEEAQQARDVTGGRPPETK